jgi:hypothetical protein
VQAQSSRLIPEREDPAHEPRTSFRHSLVFASAVVGALLVSVGGERAVGSDRPSGAPATTIVPAQRSANHRLSR